MSQPNQPTTPPSPARPPHFAQARRKSAAWKVTSVAAGDAQSDVIDISPDSDQFYQVSSDEVSTDTPLKMNTDAACHPGGDAESGSISVGPQQIDFRLDAGHPLQSPNTRQRPAVRKRINLKTRLPQVNPRSGRLLIACIESTKRRPRGDVWQMVPITLPPPAADPGCASKAKPLSARKLVVNTNR